MLCCFYWFLFLIIYVRILFFSAFVIRNYLMKFAHLQRHALVFIFCCQRCLLPRPSPPTAVWYSIFCCFCFYFYFFFRFLFIHFFLCLCHFCGYHKLVRRATFPMWKIEMCFFFGSWPRSRGHAHRMQRMKDGRRMTDSRWQLRANLRESQKRRRLRTC